MRTLRLCLSAATAVLVVGSSAGVVGADGETGASPPVAVTASRDCQGIGDAQVQIDADGTEHLRFLVSRCLLTSDDDGLDEPYILITHTDCYPEGSCAVWGTIETEGANGWRGAYRGWVDADLGSHTISALRASARSKA